MKTKKSISAGVYLQHNTEWTNDRLCRYVNRKSSVRYVKMVAINWFYLKKILAKFLHYVMTNKKKTLKKNKDWSKNIFNKRVYLAGT